MYPLQKIIHYDVLLKLKYIQSLSTAKNVVTIAKHMAKKLKKIVDKEYFVIHSPVSIQTWYKKKTQGKHYLIVSRLSKDKNIEKAINVCTANSLPLIIIGTTNDKEYLRHLKYIAGPSVEFKGFLQDKEIDNYYMNAKALLFSAEEEDFGITLVESLAHGVPVIAYNNGGPTEIIRNGIDGILYEINDEESLYKAILKLEHTVFKPYDLYKQALKFSEKNFINAWIDYLSNKEIYEQYK
jgi:glycosyltransferase involved in cell wall biosynthesis